MRTLVKKVVGCAVAAAAVAAGALCLSFTVAPCAFAEMKDIDGNVVSNTTSFAAVDGVSGTVGDFLGIGGFATKTELANGLASVALAGTNYTDAVSNELSRAIASATPHDYAHVAQMASNAAPAIASAAQDATNYTDGVAAKLDSGKRGLLDLAVYKTEIVTNDTTVVTNVVPIPLTDDVLLTWGRFGKHIIFDYLESFAIGARAVAQNTKNYGWGAFAVGPLATVYGSYSSAFGMKATVTNVPFATAIGTYAYADKTNSLAFSQTPDKIYLGSSTKNKGATAKTLQSYLDEKASATDLSSASNALSKAISSATPENYASVSNSAMNAVSRAGAAKSMSLAGDGTLTYVVDEETTDEESGEVTTNEVTKVTKLITEEQDPKFSAWKDGTSIAAGQGASVSNPVAVAIGYNSVAGATNAVAVGVMNKTLGFWSSALGYNNTASGHGSSALGYGNTASGFFSSALGIGNEASGHGSTALGTSNTASDSTSTALGDGNTASGRGSTALGNGNTVSGRVSTALGNFNTASGNYSSALGNSNTAEGMNSTALGYKAFTSNAWENALAVSQTPDLIYLGSSTTDKGATASTLQSYLDERAVRYTFAAPTDAAIAAADGKMYSVSADTNGVSVTLPAAATFSQDFVVRLAPADTNGTCLAAISGAATDSTAWQFDYPTGTNAVFGTIYAPTYYTFTQTAADRWSIFTYAATKED